MASEPLPPSFKYVGRDVAFPMHQSSSQSQLNWDDARSETLSGALQYCFSFIRRQWWLVMLGLLLGMVLFCFAFVLMPGRFEATATIMFDPSKIQLFKSSVVGDTSIESSTGMQSQIEIIGSESVARRVMDRLKLRDDPAFAPPQTSKTERLLGPTIAEMLGKGSTRSPQWIDRYQLDAFMGGLQVRRLIGTYAVQITYQSSSPSQAAQFANAVAESYLEKQLEDKKQLSRRAGEWLKNRLDELGEQVARTQNIVNAFRASHQMMEGGGLALAERRLGDLNTQLINVRSNISESSARLDRVEQAIRDYASAEIKPSLTDLMNNAIVTKLREQYFQLSNKRAEFLGRFGARHDAVKKIDQRLREIHVAVLDEYQRLAESYRSDIHISRHKEVALNNELQETMAELRSVQTARVKLRELETTSKTYQTLYDGFLRRYSESHEQEAFPFTPARMFTQASEPLGRNYKKTMKLGIVLLALGVGIGFCAALLRELSDRTFRRLNDVERTLGKPLISVMPRLSGRRARRELSIMSLPVHVDRPRTIRRDRSVIWAGDLAPHTQFSEAVRSIRLVLDQRFPEQRCKVMGVASTQPGEGSSTAAAAIAVSASTSNARVLLLDLDLRNPSLTRKLAPSVEAGLIEVLLGESKLDDALWTDPRTSLFFLPIATLRGTRPDEVLASEALDLLIADLRTRFDYVFIDLPPLVPMIDVALVSRCVDTFLGVVEWGRSEKEATRLAFERVPQFSDRLLGVAMNNVNFKRFGLYDANASQWFDEARYSNYVNLKLVTPTG